MGRWRVTTWLILGWTGLMAIWAVSGMAAVGDSCATEVGQDRELCEGATAVGAGIGLTFIFGIWFVGFIVLSIIWFMTRPREIALTGQAPANVGDELSKFAALRDTGTISAEEFEAQKARLLASTAGPPQPRPAGAKCGKCGKPVSPVWKTKCNHCGASFAEYPPVLPS